MLSRSNQESRPLIYVSHVCRSTESNFCTGSGMTSIAMLHANTSVPCRRTLLACVGLARHSKMTQQRTALFDTYLEETSPIVAHTNLCRVLTQQLPLTTQQQLPQLRQHVQTATQRPRQQHSSPLNPSSIRTQLSLWIGAINQPMKQASWHTWETVSCLL